MKHTTQTWTLKKEKNGISTIYDLAEYICSLPSNHDELEILVADLIKAFIHGEKLSVYSRLLEYAKFEENPDKHTQWLIDTCLKPKVETHAELLEKWRYGTKYSCRDQMKEFQHNE
jgi:hypothetical protein